MEEKVLIKSQRYRIGIILIIISAIVVGFFAWNFISMHTEWFNRNLEKITERCPLCIQYGGICEYHNVGGEGRAIIHEFAWEYSSGVFESFLFVGVPILVFIGLIHAWMHSYELIVTDKRVYGRTAFGKRVDLPLDSVSAVGSSWLKGVAVSTSSGRIAFLLIKNRDEIHECVSKLLIERQAKAATPATTIVQETPQSNADELKKYKELLDQGIITQEEFDAKKKQLLGL